MKLQNRDKLFLNLIVLSGISTTIVIGVVSNWNIGNIGVSIGLSILIGTGIYAYMPRKCIKCKIYMKRSITPEDHIIYTCKICNSIIDTKIGVDASP